MPLTDTAARSAKGREKPYKLTDGGGLYLLVKPEGARYWRLNYRFGGKQKALALGTCTAASSPWWTWPTTSRRRASCS
ncbi:Arm DNA-binding domain-containing protein [Xanthobacter dioxanivorans]|uniref:Arm DNA-binding domain-containing protein n=1 Tax=Xanthobacter dioxanivorans TaxID=2528964 RepID=UPI0038CD361A